MNTDPRQGVKFRMMRAQVMGIEVEYDTNMERQRTPPLLMSKVEPMSLSWGDTEVLKKVEIIVRRVSRSEQNRVQLDQFWPSES